MMRDFFWCWGLSRVFCVLRFFGCSSKKWLLSESAVVFCVVGFLLFREIGPVVVPSFSPQFFLVCDSQAR